MSLKYFAGLPAQIFPKFPINYHSIDKFHLVRRYDSFLWYHSPCRHHSEAFDVGALMHSASHAHEAPIFHCAGLKQYIGSDHHIVSDQGWVFGFPGNHTDKILKQGVLANGDCA